MVLQTGFQEAWSNHVEATPGAIVLAGVQVKALEVQSDNVVVSLATSSNYDWVQSSLRVANSVTGGKWETVTYPLLAPGVNLGSYAAGGNVYLNFALRVSDESHFRCGVTTVPVPLNVKASTGSVDIDASIAITRTC
jgi:hypothetical protein